MKKTIILIVCAVTFSLVGSNATIVTKEFKKEHEGQKYTRYERLVTLITARLNITDQSIDKKTPFHTGWGSSFFGLQHGSGPSGGWSRWDFLSCSELFNGKLVNTISANLATNISVFELDDIVVADITIPTKNVGNLLKIRVIETTKMPQWVFLQVTTENYSAKRLTIMGYAGGANIPKERQRHIIYNNRNYIMNKEVIYLKNPTSPFMAFYNKFAQVNDGLLFVFNPQDFTLMSSGKTASGNSIGLTPQVDKRVFRFGFGYFKGINGEKASQEFIQKDGAVIKKFMDEELDWNIMPSQKFTKLVAELKKMNVPATQIDPICKKFESAMSKKDTSSANKAIQELEQIKKSSLKSKLNAFN